MRRLIMIGGGGDPAPPPPFEHFPLSTASQIVVDGNSISANHGAIATLAEVISERLGTARAGTLIESTAISGQTWANMLTNHADVDALWNPDKTFHALVINETTNSIRLGATVEQTKQDIRDYVEAVTAANPWVVIAWPALPVGHADETTYPGEVVKNQGIIEVNNWMRDNATDIGIHHWLDVRSQYPQFDHDGSAAGPFTAYQAGWQEIPPSTPWNMFGWLHPTVGAWGAGSTPPTGKRAIATTIGDAFLNHTIRAFA